MSICVSQQEYQSAREMHMSRPMHERLSSGDKVYTSGGYKAIILDSDENGIEYAYQSPEDMLFDGLNNDVFERGYRWDTQKVNVNGKSDVYHHVEDDLHLTERFWK